MFRDEPAGIERLCESKGDVSSTEISALPSFVTVAARVNGSLPATSGPSITQETFGDATLYRSLA